MSAELPPVCDYEGSDYQERFWGGEARQYEDQVERIALRRLMPAKGNTLIEIGAGFGRLADEYHSYQKVILFDYSRSLLRQAQENLGDDPRFLYVAGNWYKMPFVANAFDTLVQIRTLHHAADVPTLLGEIAGLRRVDGDGGRPVGGVTTPRCGGRQLVRTGGQGLGGGPRVQAGGRAVSSCLGRR
jgi:hypothetical protein